MSYKTGYSYPEEEYYYNGCDYDYDEYDENAIVDSVIYGCNSIYDIFMKFVEPYISNKINNIDKRLPIGLRDDMIHFYKECEKILDEKNKQFKTVEESYNDLVKEQICLINIKEEQKRIDNREKAEKRIVYLYTKKNKSIHELTRYKSVLQLHPDYYNYIPKNDLKIILKKYGVRLDSKREPKRKNNKIEN
jgi:hypothetical protein